MNPKYNDVIIKINNIILALFFETELDAIGLFFFVGWILSKGKSIKSLKQNFKVRLIIIGKGNNKEILKKYIFDNNLQNKIKLFGYTNNPFPYVQKADIVALTSKFEGLPNILLEAQYLKKYIISTDCPTGPKEILFNGKAGDLIKVGDYRGLSLLIKNYSNRKKSILNKINVGYKNFYRFDHSLNCKKYLNFINKNY